MFLGWTELDGSPFSTMSKKARASLMTVSLSHSFLSQVWHVFSLTFFFLGVQDLPQYEATKAYMPKALDELVIVLQEVEGKCGSFQKWCKFHTLGCFFGFPSCLLEELGQCMSLVSLAVGWCHGERMRDGERGWFPANCATQITNRTAMENNV